MKRYRPTFYCKSIFDIPLTFFKENNIKCIFSDLDNTLDAYDVLTPSPRVVELKEKLQRVGVELCIISNNKAKHKEIYCKRLNVRGVFSCRKPSSKRVLKFISLCGYNKDEVLIVGDQIITDVGCAYYGKVRVCLTDPISEKDQWTTKFNRLIDRPIRHHLHKIDYLKEVDINGKQK